MSQLILGNWPELKRLDVSYNVLNTAAIASLSQAPWPLVELQLSGNLLDVEAMHQLIQGRWPQLMHLGLKWSKLNAQIVAVLVKAPWQAWAEYG